MAANPTTSRPAQLQEREPAEEAAGGGSLPDAAARAVRAWQRWERGGKEGVLSDLDDAIAGFEEALAALASSDGQLSVLAEASRALAARYARTRQRGDLERSIALVEQALQGLPDHHELRAALHSALASGLSERFTLTGAPADLDGAVAHAETAADTTPEGDASKSGRLSTLANRLAERFRLTGARADLHSAIATAEEAIHLTPADDARRPGRLNNYANNLSERFRLTGVRSDLDVAIARAEEAVGLTPQGHRRKPSRLNTLANRLSERFRLTGALEDLNAAIAHANKVVALTSVGHCDRPTFLNNLATHLAARFKLSGDRTDLDAAIVHAEEAVRLTPEGDAEAPGRLSNLANRLSNRFALTGVQADLDAAVAHSEAAVRLAPEPHARRPLYLHGLVNRLSMRFSVTGARADLDAAIAHAESAVHMTLDGHIQKPGRLSALSNRLSDRFNLTGSRVDLDAALSHAERALSLVHEDHSNRAMYLNNLANRLSERFRLTAARSDLEVAITHAELAVRLAPEGHGDRPAHLNSLANRLSARFRLTGARTDLDAAIAYAENAIRLTPEGHGDRPGRHNNLAARLGERFSLTSDCADLDAAITHAEAAVRLTPDGHSHKPMCHNNLAHRMAERFALSGTRVDLDAAIGQFENAVASWQQQALESEDADLAAGQADQNARRLLALLLKAGEPARLVRALEVSKVIRLRVDLAGQGHAPVHLDPAGERRYHELRDSMRRITSDLRALDALADRQEAAHAARVAQLSKELQLLRKERGRLEAGDAAFAGMPLDYAAVRQRAMAANEAIVYLQPLIDEPAQLLVLVVHASSPDAAPAAEDVIFVDGLGHSSITNLLTGGRKEFLSGTLHALSFDAVGWITANQVAKHLPTNEAARELWLDTMNRIISLLGRDVMLPLARRLAAVGAERVVLLPGEGMAMLPLHAAPIDDVGTPFAEHFEVRYAPSATALAAAAQPLPFNRLVGIANPDGSLAFSDLQMRTVAGQFGDWASIRHGSGARRAWLLDQARRGDILALSTHAAFNLNRPERSFFILAHPKGERLTTKVDHRRDVIQDACEKLHLDDILRGALQLKRGALVVADACETGQIEIGITVNEFVGFPAAFLASGASAVVGTLWSVSDFSTALLMTEMYRRLRNGEPPARALQQAVRWLRRLGKAEIVSRLEAEVVRATTALAVQANRRKAMNIAERQQDSTYHDAVRYLDILDNALDRVSRGADPPFTHPLYWAAFAVHGNSAHVVQPSREQYSAP